MHSHNSLQCSLALPVGGVFCVSGDACRWQRSRDTNICLLRRLWSRKWRLRRIRPQLSHGKKLHTVQHFIKIRCTVYGGARVCVHMQHNASLQAILLTVVTSFWYIMRKVGKRMSGSGRIMPAHRQYPFTVRARHSAHTK